MLMSRTNMYRPQFRISIRNEKMTRVTQQYGLLRLPLWFSGDCSGSYCIYIRCDPGGPPRRSGSTFLHQRGSALASFLERGFKTTKLLGA